MRCLRVVRGLRHVLLGVVLVAGLLGAGVAGAQEPSGNRVALVIGNRAYAFSPVKPAVNDARKVTAALTELGFQVEHRENLDRKQMEKAILEMKERRSDGGTLLFYFSGHGAQVKGANYIIPVGGAVQVLEDIPAQAVALDLVLESMGDAGPNIVILDACRDTPFPPSVTEDPDWRKGLSESQPAPRDTLIAFSTSPGQTTPFSGERSPYTAALLQYIRTPGLRLSELFIKVRHTMLAEELRVTWVNGSQLEDAFLRPASRASFRIHQADDDVMLLVNGRVVATAQQHGVGKDIEVRLRPGENPLEVMVYNQRTVGGGTPILGGRRPEGWAYSVSVGSAGRELVQFQGGEARPELKGPRHGNLFMAARATLFVDSMTGAVTLRDVDPQVWQPSVEAKLGAKAVEPSRALPVKSKVPPAAGCAGAACSSLGLRLMRLAGEASGVAADARAWVAARQSLWSRLRKPFHIVDQLWFTLGVQEVIVGAQKGAGALSWVPVSVRCRPRIVVSEREPDSGPLFSITPGRVEEGPSVLAVHADVPLKFLRALLHDEMLDTPFEFDAGVEAAVDEVLLREQGGRLVVDIGLQKPLEGRVVLTGRLTYDKLSKALLLRDAEVAPSMDVPPSAIEALRRRLAVEPLWRLETDLGYTGGELVKVLERALGPAARVSAGGVELQGLEVVQNGVRVIVSSPVIAELPPP